MKRFILFSLSAATALTLGAVTNARAQSEGPEPGVYLDRNENLTDGIISPNAESPNNRVIPDRGALEYDSAEMDEPGVYLDDDLDQTDGIISPNSESPNNRQVPGEGVSE